MKNKRLLNDIYKISEYSFLIHDEHNATDDIGFLLDEKEYLVIKRIRLIDRPSPPKYTTKQLRHLLKGSNPMADDVYNDIFGEDNIEIYVDNEED